MNEKSWYFWFYYDICVSSLGTFQLPYWLLVAKNELWLGNALRYNDVSTLQAEAVVTSKILSGKCSVNVLKVTYLFLLAITISGII